MLSGCSRFFNFTLSTRTSCSFWAELLLGCQLYFSFLLFYAVRPYELICSPLTSSSISFFFYHFYFSCQDRIGAVVNIAIDLLSYLLNLCASFGWQSAHTIYCAKFIRLNRRAIFQEIKNIRLMEHVKVIGTILRRNGIAIYYFPF